MNSSEEAVNRPQVVSLDCCVVLLVGALLYLGFLSVWCILGLSAWLVSVWFRETLSMLLWFGAHVNAVLCAFGSWNVVKAELLELRFV